jgi:sulfoxide reductase heme-binding subunit YedZ
MAGSRDVTGFGSQTTWFVARGSGAVCLVFLTMSLVLGVPTLLSWGVPRVPRLVVQLLHRNVSLLILMFLAVHVLSSVLDSFVDIRFIEAVVPFVGTYRPIWLGLGAIATDLLLALIVTSLVRRHMSFRAWKLVHWSAYACWPIAVVHGLGTGSDTRFGWMLVLDALCAAAVIGAVAWRLAVRPQRDLRWRVTAATAVVVVPVIIGTFLVLGPMRPGWGHSARSPARTSSTARGAG